MYKSLKVCALLGTLVVSIEEGEYFKKKEEEVVEKTNLHSGPYEYDHRPDPHQNYYGDDFHSYGNGNGSNDWHGFGGYDL